MLPNLISWAHEDQHKYFLLHLDEYEEIPEGPKRQLLQFLYPWAHLASQEKVVYCLDYLCSVITYPGAKKSLNQLQVPTADQFGGYVISKLLEKRFSLADISRVDITSIWNVNMLDYLTKTFDATFYILKTYFSDKPKFLVVAPNPKFIYRVAAHKLSERLESGDIAFFYLYLKCAHLADGHLNLKLIENHLSMLVAMVTQMSETRYLEWQQLLDYLQRFPENSLESIFRNIVIERLQEQYNHMPILQQLNVESVSPLFRVFRSVLFSQHYKAMALLPKFPIAENGPGIIGTPCGTLPPLRL